MHFYECLLPQPNSMSSKGKSMSRYVFSGMSLYARSGMRKYINRYERERFLQVAHRHDPSIKTFCMLLAYTGCRLSEALELSASAIQLEANVISLRCLKKRDQHVIREVPVPSLLIEALDEVHQIHDLQLNQHGAGAVRLWPWGRTWGWTCVKKVMDEACISGLHASPKGLRHGFGVYAVQSGIPLSLVQKWLGHAEMSTTAIYADVVGPEERMIAERMW